jgi:hypothetical protein
MRLGGCYLQLYASPLSAHFVSSWNQLTHLILSPLRLPFRLLSIWCCLLRCTSKPSTGCMVLAGAVVSVNYGELIVWYALFLDMVHGEGITIERETTLVCLISSFPKSDSSVVLRIWCSRWLPTRFPQFMFDFENWWNSMYMIWCKELMGFFVLALFYIDLNNLTWLVQLFWEGNGVNGSLKVVQNFYF